MSRDNTEATLDAKIDRVKDETSDLAKVVQDLQVALVLCPENPERIGHHLAKVHRHLGRTTQAVHALHPTDALATGVWRLLSEDRGEA